MAKKEALINVKIDGIPVQVPAGTSILDAAKLAGVRIPTLCYLRGKNEIGACRVCVVELKGRGLVASCVYPVSEGMEILASSKRVLDARKTTVELILSDHDKNCTSCVRSGNCELQTLSNDLNCDGNRFQGSVNNFEEEVTPYLVRDNEKCILCRRCVAACKNVQGVSVIGANERGFKTHIGCAFDKNLNDVPCAACGQCINVCPTGALREKDEIDNVVAALNDPEMHVVVAPAPAVRAAIGEEFGFPIGTNTEGKLATALRMLNFDAVFDVDFTADLTILEEGTELLGRIQNKGVLPMITSCSPGWINFIELYYPEYLAHLSTCKSPQNMYGAIIKTYYAQKHKLDPKKIYTVSIMPCTAKKDEKIRPQLQAAGKGIPDIDAVLTTRELARLIKRKGIMFNQLPDGEFDKPFGVASTAGLLFGATGGVMEAALRTVAEIINAKPLGSLDFKEVRGVEGIKEASYPLDNGMVVKVCVAHGLSNARKVMELIKAGKADYHFIEVMCCPGGCVTGGGQPIQPADVHNSMDIRAVRAKAIYDADKKSKFRKSHENKHVDDLYTEFLGKPNSHKAHEVLHTHYTKQDKF